MFLISYLKYSTQVSRYVMPCKMSYVSYLKCFFLSSFFEQSEILTCFSPQTRSAAVQRHSPQLRPAILARLASQARSVLMDSQPTYVRTISIAFIYSFTIKSRTHLKHILMRLLSDFNLIIRYTVD